MPPLRLVQHTPLPGYIQSILHSRVPDGDGGVCLVVGTATQLATPLPGVRDAAAIVTSVAMNNPIEGFEQYRRLCFTSGTARAQYGAVLRQMPGNRVLTDALALSTTILPGIPSLAPLPYRSRYEARLLAAPSLPGDACLIGAICSDVWVGTSLLRTVVALPARFCLSVCAPARLHPQLSQLIGAYDLDRRVELRGEPAPDWWGGLDRFLHLDPKDDWGAGIQTAQQLAVPCIGIDYGVSRDRLDNDCGVLVPAGHVRFDPDDHMLIWAEADPTEVARAITSLTDGEAARLAYRSSETFVTGQWGRDTVTANAILRWLGYDA